VRDARNAAGDVEFARGNSIDACTRDSWRTAQRKGWLVARRPEPEVMGRATPVAWLTVDDHDNRDLWHHESEARRYVGDAGGTVEPLVLASAQGPVRDDLARLENARLRSDVAVLLRERDEARAAVARLTEDHRVALAGYEKMLEAVRTMDAIITRVFAAPDSTPAETTCGARACVRVGGA
jgi:hypothetical protein